MMAGLSQSRPINQVCCRVSTGTDSGGSSFNQSNLSYHLATHQIILFGAASARLVGGTDDSAELRTTSQ